ncbi:MAG: DUF1643 domain-containing protein [Halioglobus sp.]|nr:DUF1643 domain-containing protein [Halioglobus sp.]
MSRVWDRSQPLGAFVLLNPSTATALVSDQTMSNCNNLAIHWGWGGFYIVNLYAYRATDPAELKRQRDPVGVDNDRELLKVTRRAAFVVLAWGNGHRKRARDVLCLLSGLQLYCIRRNAGGGFLHPARINAANYPRPTPVQGVVAAGKA